MPNSDRRKLKRKAIGAYIDSAKRRANKIEDGKSVLPLSEEYRRYVSKMNAFCGSSVSWQHPPTLCG